VPLSICGDIVYNLILVIIDRYLKIVLYFLVKKTIIAIEVADILIDTVFTYYRFPIGIVSDHDLRFTSEF
jgi:hypothetical protein